MPEPVGPGHQHEPLGQVAEVEDLLRQAHLLGREDLGRDLRGRRRPCPCGRGRSCSGSARGPRSRRRSRCRCAAGTPRGSAPARSARGCARVSAAVRTGRSVSGRISPSMPQDRRRARADVEVGRLALDHQRKSVVDLRACRRCPRYGASAWRGRGAGAAGRRQRAAAGSSPPGTNPACSAPFRRSAQAATAPTPGHVQLPVGASGREALPRVRRERAEPTSWSIRLARLRGALYLALAGRRHDHHAPPGREQELASTRLHRRLQQSLHRHQDRPPSAASRVACCSRWRLCSRVQRYEIGCEVQIVQHALLVLGNVDVEVALEPLPRRTRCWTSRSTSQDHRPGVAATVTATSRSLFRMTALDRVRPAGTGRRGGRR